MGQSQTVEKKMNKSQTDTAEMKMDKTQTDTTEMKMDKTLGSSTENKINKVLIMGEEKVGKTSVYNLLKESKRNFQLYQINLPTQSKLKDEGCFVSSKDISSNAVCALPEKWGENVKLIVIVVQKGRWTTSGWKVNYMVRKLIEQNVPVLYVITGCDGDNPLQGYADRFKEKNVVCVCSIDPYELSTKHLEMQKILLESRTESAKALLEKINTYFY